MLENYYIIVIIKIQKAVFYLINWYGLSYYFFPFFHLPENYDSEISFYTIFEREVVQIEMKKRTSLVAQWLRICLPMQETWVRSLVWKTPHVAEQLSPCTTTTEASEPRAREPQLLSLHATTTEAHAPRAQALQQEKPPQWEAHDQQRRVAPTRQN